jgi:Tfp pilus assembly protein PilV
MNLKHLSKLMAAGVLAMASVPAISIAHTHRPVTAAPALMASTNGHAKTRISKTKRISLASSKRRLTAKTKAKTLAAHRKAHVALTHRTHRATKLHTTRKVAHAV